MTTPVTDDAAMASELATRLPGYLAPELAPRAGGLGGALLDVLSHYAGLVDAAVSGGPGKERLAALDALGITLLPPRPARAPLVFTLAADAPVDVLLPADSEAAADVPPPLPSTLAEPDQPASVPGPIVFAAEQSISLARARVASIRSVVAAEDAWAEHAPEATSGFRLFSDLEPVPHHLYLGHDTLFELPPTAEVAVLIGLSQAASGATRGLPLSWEYLTADGWIPFEPVLDLTRGLRADGDVRLRKECGPPPVRAPIAGVESFWLRARTTEPLPLPGAAGEAARVPRIDRIRASVRYRLADLPVDEAVANGLPVDPSREFRPLGDEPRAGSTLLFACDEAFGRPGATIGVTLVPAASSAAERGTRTLRWEYSTANGRWGELTKSSYQMEKGDPHEVRFARPDDWQKVPVGGTAHFWLRVRLETGDYGGPVKYTVANGTVTMSNEPKPPLLETLAVAYEYSTAPAVLDHCITLNGFAFEDRTTALRWGREGVVPFTPLDDPRPAVQIGFDRALPAGLVSLLVDAGGDVAAAQTPTASPFAWEYRSPAGWSELPVLDDSAGFATTGMFQFIGPADHAPSAGPTGPLHWIRGREKGAGGTPDPIPVARIEMNAVWATNRRAVRAEVLGRADGTARLTLPTQHAPVLPREVLEVQEWAGTGAEWQSLLRDVDSARRRLERDPRGLVTAVWVTWEERPYLHASAPGERHYAIERSAGLVRFGDGNAGRQPPPGAAIALSYAYGGGPGGNVAAGRIAQLHSAVPHVQSVVNPLPASGGAPAERPGGAGGGVLARGGQQLRHRQRALTPSDYEWLARDASAEVAVARCLPATGTDGAGRPGEVTVLVAPASTEARPRPSAGLLRQVHAHLAGRAPAAMVSGLRVIGPAYRQVSVLAQVAVTEPERAAQLEEALRRALDAFLHPLSGGPSGAGWDFGASVHLSQVAVVVAAVPGVAATEEIRLSSDGVVHGETVPLEAHRLPAAGAHLLKLRPVVS